jgi:hypothetical protein
MIAVIPYADLKTALVSELWPKPTFMYVERDRSPQSAFCALQPSTPGPTRSNVAVGLAVTTAVAAVVRSNQISNLLSSRDISMEGGRRLYFFSCLAAVHLHKVCSTIVVPELSTLESRTFC